MDELLVTIKEVQEGGKFLANWYLDRGYILLDIQSGARVWQYPDARARQVGQQFYINRSPVYVLGRPDGVVIAPRPPKRTMPEGDESTVSGETGG